MASRNVRMPKNQPDGVVGKKSEYFGAGTLKSFSSYVSRHTLVRPGFNIFLWCTTKIISLFIQHRELGKKTQNKTVSGPVFLMAVEGMIHDNICRNTKRSH